MVSRLQPCSGCWFPWEGWHPESLSLVSTGDPWGSRQAWIQGWGLVDSVLSRGLAWGPGLATRPWLALDKQSDVFLPLSPHGQMG